MSDQPRNDNMEDNKEDTTEKAAPIEELRDFVLEEDHEFPDRVKRSLNRHLLVGDSLEFSLDVLQKTMWEYLKSFVEVWPSRRDKKSE